MTSITVHTSKKRFPTAPSLYGLFFEDINRSGDGGLYPELLRNRAFDDSLYPDDLTAKGDDLENATGWPFEYQKGEGQKRWREKLEPTEIPAWYGDRAVYTLDCADTLNENRQAAFAVEFEPGGSIWNVGYSGVAVQKGKAYHLYFFAKAAEVTCLRFAIEGKEQSYCEQEIRIGTNGYVRYDLTLIPDQTDKEAVLKITAQKGGRVRFGFMSLMPEDTYCGHGLRKDLCEKLEALHPAFLRFPGGCIVEGFSKSTVQRFKRMAGQPWKRPGVLNLWGYRSTEGLGFHEYLQLCEDLHTDALYVCNCGMTCQARHCILMEQEEIDDLLDDVLCALEYAFGSPDTTWGALRTEMGHPAPFALKYLEIGNENNGPDYEERYEYFRKVISEKYPELIIVANTHVEKSGLALDIADEHFYDKAEWFAQNSHYYDDYDRKGPGIFVGEFAVVAGNIRTLYAALGEAMFMVGMERNQDIVKLAAYAPLFENVHYAAWEPNLIAFDGLSNYAIPSYYVWKLFSENKGKYVLESEQESEPVYAPFLKGGPCLIGSEGIHFKHAEWKGEPAAATRELFGSVRDCGNEVFTTEIRLSEAEAERAKRFGMEKTVLIVLGEDVTSRSGKFSIDLLAEPEKELGIGMFATPYGEARNSEDSPWNLFAVQPIRWTIKDRQSTVTAGVGFRQYPLADPTEVSLEPGVFHNLCMESDGKRLRCSLDGVCVTEVELPHYEEIQAVALEDADNLIIKVVNIAEEERDIAITLDCPVETEYRAGVLTGEPSDRNTLENPETVTEHWNTLTGADAAFTYQAPASSVNVLCLKKK